MEKAESVKHQGIPKGLGVFVRLIAYISVTYVLVFLFDAILLWNFGYMDSVFCVRFSDIFTSKRLHGVLVM